MPKVTQEYRDARREQILAAARRCFLRSGFQRTSMQDIFAEAGLSSGAVYRYFASKEDMILAISEESMTEMLETIHRLGTPGQEETLGDAVARILLAVQDMHRDRQAGALAMLVWAEAVRNPAFAARFTSLIAEIRAQLCEVVRTRQAGLRLPTTVSTEAYTAFLMSIVPGYLMQLAVFGEGLPGDVPQAAAALLPH